MNEDPILLEKREEIKIKLATGEYQTLLNFIFDGTGRLINKLTRNKEPLPFWYNALVFALVTLLISFLTSMFLGERNNLRLNVIPREIFTVILAFAGTIGIKHYINTVFTKLHLNILDAIGSLADLVDLQDWLSNLCNIKTHLFFSLPFGILAGLGGSLLLYTIRGGFSGFGPTILGVIIEFQVGIAIYFIFLFLNLPLRISNYRLKLYSPDPFNSEVIKELSGMFNRLVYIIAIIAAGITFFQGLSGLLTSTMVIVLILFAWGPLIILFILNHYALAKIITRAKWQKLNEIQSKIEILEAREHIPDEVTLANLNSLMDYHARIVATRNSALDIPAGLGFLYSLLLPLITFLLGNLENFEMLIAYFK